MTIMRQFLSVLSVGLFIFTSVDAFPGLLPCLSCPVCPSCNGNDTLRPGPTTASQAQDYFLRFGYLTVTDLWSGDGKAAFERAVRLFQWMANVNETGELNADTYRMLRTERCGNLDISVDDLTTSDGGRDHIFDGVTPKRRKRFAIQGTKWQKQHLTYRITNYTTDLSRQEVDKTVVTAFQVWANVTPLTFTPSTCFPVDIEIYFAKGDHGDGNAFDGQWGTLGHSFFPYANTGIDGDTHFDEAEKWVLGLDDDGANLLYTAAHEFGHSLGLQHSEVFNSLMWPWASATRSDVNLSDDDIQGIQMLYGNPEDFDPTESIPETKCVTTPPALAPTVTTATEATTTTTTTAATTTTTVTTTTVRAGKVTSPLRTVATTTRTRCSGRVDAITEAADNRIYVFRNNQVFRMNDISYDPGFPKDIDSVFPKAPRVVDAATTVDLRRKSGRVKTYLISGNKVWRYSVQGSRYQRQFLLDIGYPRNIYQEFGMDVNRVDTAFNPGGKKADKIYIVAGYTYWAVRFDRKGKAKSESYPSKKDPLLKHFTHIDAAFRLSVAGKTYLYSGQEYYRYTSGRKGTIMGPRDTGYWWFGCPGP